MKIAILGAGAIGKKHAEAVQPSGAEISWVIDSDSRKAQALAAECGARHAAAVDVVWNDDTTTAVVVAVPNWLHSPLTLAALAAGKDVLLEKPMALSVAECQELSAAAEQHGRVLQIGFAHRYTGVGRVARRLIAEQRLGNVYHARANLFLRRGVPGLGKWFTTKEYSGGGALIDVGVHLLDLALFLLGFPEPVQVLGQTYEQFGRRMKDYDYENMWAGPPDFNGVCNVEDSVEALVKFTGGATLELHVAWAGNYPSKLMPVSQMAFLGDRGGLGFELFGTEVHLAEVQQGKLVDIVEPVDAEDFLRLQFQDFLSGIADRKVRGASAEQGTQVQKLVEAIYASSDVGESIVLA